MAQVLLGCRSCDTVGDVKIIRLWGQRSTYCAACFVREARRRGMSIGAAAVAYAWAE